VAAPASTVAISGRSNSRGVGRLIILMPPGPITAYKVYRDVAEGATTLLDTVTPVVFVLNRVALYYDATTVAGTLYWYRVKATNDDGDSGYSNEVKIRAEDYVVADPAPTGALKAIRHTL